jgi:hypothetical protein
MKYYFLASFGLLVFLIETSCKKAVSPVIDAQLIGKWAWVSSGFGNDILVGQSSGVQKTLLFKNDGTMIITHNDSTGNYDVLPVEAPTVLLTKSISATATYQVISENAGCVNIKFPTLVIEGQYGYQYEIFGDTLQITPGHCLAPYATNFVKIN